MRNLVFLLLVAVASAKVYERCELARVLKANGMDGYYGTTVADWVCLSKWESNYNTRAYNYIKGDGSSDYGIFQINSRYWCHDGPTSKGCGYHCPELLTDDLIESMYCAKRIVRDWGIRTWVAWRRHCEGRDLSSFVEGCGL
ncbi:lysozyme C-like [Sebastes umbrosus]|uniref:lysozyme C-like n=1 Tax=Sebastes umbrosus TaxID=72105 RepID=UPI00189EB113|nr:lysozyme C-like [Sebastes umbrosus]XP_037609029.1 lysozyme C-like [Sebastes umbrosus]XP_037609031.1 lysozyme C-like [Sebastes umbrosus]